MVFFILTLVVYLFSIGFLVTSYALMSAHIKITHVSGIPITFYLSAYGFLLLVFPGVVMWTARRDGKLPLFFKIYTFFTAAYLVFFALREILKVFTMTYYEAWNLRLWPQMAFFALGFWAAVKAGRIPKKQLRRIVARIQALGEEPRPQGCEKLSAQERYRIRQEDYRIVYGIDDSARTVEIVKIGNGSEVYRDR